MDLASFIGFSVCLILVLGGMSSGPNGVAGALSFWDVPSVLITGGGTLGVLLLGVPLERFLKFPTVFQKVFFGSSPDMVGLVQTMVSFAEKARREGLLALEEDAGQLDDEFLRKSIQLVVDGTDPELVKAILDTEIGLLEDRHGQNKKLLDTMAEMAPAFGMLGTLVGLVQMLQNLNDPSSLGPGMAVAIITSFYGSFIANVIALPMGKKLAARTGQEVLCRELMVEGVLAIQAGENPRIVEEKLKVFLPPVQRKKLEEDKNASKGGE